MKQPRKILIDTDPGHDDAMALMLACKSPELEVVAVTTVAGNSTIENTTRNGRFILDFIGRKDISLFSGASKPLKRELVKAVVHGESGLDGADTRGTAVELTDDAAAKMIELVRQNPDDLTIVTLGPLTNLAEAITRDPKTMSRVKEIASMGGAIEVPGNKNRVAEFNVFVDPEAADIVMNFPVPKVLVPLDACNHVMMQLEDVQRITDRRLRKLLVTMLAPYIQNIAKDAGVEAALMYDPLTVFYLLEPDACKARLMNVEVETKGEITRGMTVVDRRTVSDGKQPNVTVVTYIEADRFVERFVKALSTK